LAASIEGALFVKHPTPKIVEARVGEGSVLLFGFQPNYRAQSVVTWPLLFRALIPPAES